MYQNANWNRKKCDIGIIISSFVISGAIVNLVANLVNATYAISLILVITFNFIYSWKIKQNLVYEIAYSSGNESINTQQIEM